MGAVWGTEMGYGRIDHHGDSRYKRFVDYTKDDEESLYKGLLHAMKTSDTEIFYFGYRAGLGAMLGAALGCSLLTTVVRK